MPHIRQELLIGASTEKVYEAIVTQKGLSGWWTPETRAKPERDSVARFAFGPTYFKEMKIEELHPSTRVRWHCIAGADEWLGTSLCFQLFAGDRASFENTHPEASGQLRQHPGNAVTALHFSHDNWRDYTPMFAECSFTWGRFLQSLRMLCETGRGRPYPHQYDSAL
jgi:uncharacterized protein YndB with AHSA1/START domain